jgi:glycogen(starch) synthase
MRILHLTEGFWPRIGGVEVLVQNLAVAQCHAGHEVAIATNHLGSAASPPGFPAKIEIHRFPFHQALTGHETARVGQIVREVSALKQSFQPDVIHLHVNGYIPWLHQLTAGASAAPCVATLHVPPTSVSLPAPILARVLRAVARIVGVSEATRREWALAHPNVLENDGVILNGIPEPAAPVQPLRFDPPVLLCLGRLDPLKGFDIALRAFASLATRWPGARLVIAGDGPARAELEQLTRELDLSARVVFRGWVAPDAVAAEIGSASLVLVPSLWNEPFGLVAVEAALAGRPLIASRKGGLVEIVRDGATGVLVPAGDAPALAAAIESLLRQPELARRLAAAGRERALADFSLGRCVAEYETLYRQMLPQTVATSPA